MLVNCIGVLLTEAAEEGQIKWALSSPFPPFPLRFSIEGDCGSESLTRMAAETWLWKFSLVISCVRLIPHQGALPGTGYPGGIRNVTCFVALSSSPSPQLDKKRRVNGENGIRYFFSLHSIAWPYEKMGDTPAQEKEIFALVTPGASNGPPRFHRAFARARSRLSIRDVTGEKDRFFGLM